MGYVHVAEAVHKPTSPEHVKPIADLSRRYRLGKLAGEFHTRAQAAHDHVLFSSETAGRGGEATRENVRQLRDKAGEYSLGLYGYWTYAKERFSDVYIYRSEGTRAELNELLGPLKETDARLEKQLKDWAEATSPYGDTYDATRIEEVGRDLSETLKIASAYLINHLRELHPGEKGARDTSFSSAMLLAVSGLAEQIGSRMGDLGAGRTVPDVTMANATIEIMNRAGQDGLKFRLEAKSDTTSAARDALDTFTPEFVESKLKEHYSIEDQLAVLKETNPESERLHDQLEKVGLVPFFEALAEHTGPRGDADLIAARDRLIFIKGELKKLKLDPTTRAEYLAERKTLLETMLPKMRTLMEATVQQNTERLDQYETTLRDSTDGFNDDPYGFWSNTKKKVLSQIEAVAGVETRKKLDEALGSGNLSDKVGKWTDIVTKDPKPDPKTMQSRALDVVTTADQYLERIEGVLKDADADDALRELKGQLLSALTAIRLSTAEKLTYQFEQGRFRK